jgi:hypothetical protein
MKALSGKRIRAKEETGRVRLLPNPWRNSVYLHRLYLSTKILPIPAESLVVEA